MPGQLPQLIVQAQQGQREAFNELVALFDQPARRVAWQILGNMPDAEDALQDAWMVVWRQLGKLRDPNLFAGWLYRIVANVSLRKRQQRSAAAAKVDALRHLAIDCAVENEAPSNQQGSLARMVGYLPAALQALSTNDHLVVTLHYFSGLGIDRIAALLDLPAGTVKSRLYHARQTIRKEMEQWQTR